LLIFCGQRGIALIADEVFLDFSLKESHAVSFAAKHKPLTFVLGGLSKFVDCRR